MCLSLPPAWPSPAIASCTAGSLLYAYFLTSLYCKHFFVKANPLHLHVVPSQFFSVFQFEDLLHFPLSIKSYRKCPLTYVNYYATRPFLLLPLLLYVALLPSFFSHLTY
nr:MAG TPA: hypothetical protein [Caudoviricetes sp.]